MSQTFDPAVLNDPEISSQIKGTLKDISDLMTIAASNRTAITEHYKALAEQTAVPNRILRKLGRTYHRNSFQDEQDDAELFAEAYEQVFGIPS